MIDMTEKEYRNYPAISHSSLLKIGESPEKFKYYLENKEEPTKSLIFGQLFHKMALLPESLKDDFIIIPNVDRRTKEGKNIYSEFLRSCEGRISVNEDMIEQSEKMVESLFKNDFANKLLKGYKEKEFFWIDILTQEPCKCRFDCITDINDTLIAVDLKTTDNAETEAFTRSSIKYGYDVQAAMYLDGLKANTNKDAIFVFIAIEKNPPYSINILQADKLFIKRGYDRFRELIGIYHDCKISNNWYGYLGKYNQINNLALPAYLAREIE